MTRKEIRHKKMAAIILERGYIPKTGELAQALGVTECTVERDLRELSDLVPESALEEIKTSLMLRLRDRIPSMKDHNLIKLAEFFLAKKTAIAAAVAAQQQLQSLSGKLMRMGMERILRNRWIPERPHPETGESGPTVQQWHFLVLPCLEAFYGGAAGGGKSDALLMAAAMYVHIPDYHAIIFQKTLQSLKRAREAYMKVDYRLPHHKPDGTLDRSRRARASRYESEAVDIANYFGLNTQNRVLGESTLIESSLLHILPLCFVPVPLLIFAHPFQCRWRDQFTSSIKNTGEDRISKKI